MAWNFQMEINGLRFLSTVTTTFSQHFTDCLELQVSKANNTIEL